MLTAAILNGCKWEARHRPSRDYIGLLVADEGGTIPRELPRVILALGLSDPCRCRNYNEDGYTTEVIAVTSVRSDAKP